MYSLYSFCDIIYSDKRKSLKNSIKKLCDDSEKDLILNAI